MLRKFLLASDFDQTLSFNDSGVVLSELIGFHSFHDKVKGLANIYLIQQGAELSYLILHDPDFRRVRREHLVETGRRIRLKHDVALFARVLDTLGEEHKFYFNVISWGAAEITLKLNLCSSPRVSRTRANSATSCFRRIRLPVSTRCSRRTRRKSGSWRIR